MTAPDAAFNMSAHLARQSEWSERTFGPGHRTKGIVDHIRKELREIEAAPGDLEEWIDVAILALDGAWRAGFTPEQILAQLIAKQGKNEARKWPDWRTMPADKAIEHHRIKHLRIVPSVTKNRFVVQRRSLFFWWDNAHPSWRSFATREDAQKYMQELAEAPA